MTKPFLLDVTWAEFPNDVVIKDLTEEHYDNIEKLLREECFGKMVALSYLDALQDAEALNDFVTFLMSLIKGGTSIIIFNTATKEIYGFAILRVIEIYEKAPWIQSLIAVSLKNSKIQHLLSLCKLLSSQFCDRILKKGFKGSVVDVFVKHVKKSQKGNAWHERLMQCAYKVAQSMFCSYITFLSCNFNDQIRALNLGMREENRLYYGHFRAADGTCPFKLKKGGEYYVVFFSAYVRSPKRYQDYKI